MVPYYYSSKKWYHQLRNRSSPKQQRYGIVYSKNRTTILPSVAVVTFLLVITAVGTILEIYYQQPVALHDDHVVGIIIRRTVPSFLLLEGVNGATIPPYYQRYEEERNNNKKKKTKTTRQQNSDRAQNKKKSSYYNNNYQQQQNFNYNDNFSSSSFQNTINGTEFLQSIFKNTETKKPRHIIQGIWFGLNSALTGTIMAIVSLAAIPFMGFQKGGYKGLLSGSFVGMLYAGIFMITGYGQALHKVWQGLTATPAALFANHVGQIWDDSKQQYNFYYLDHEATELSKNDSAARRRGSTKSGANSGVMDTMYYDLLKVPVSASSKDIKRAYYRQAKDVHPDKNPSKEASEQFRIIHMAYTTLYDDEKRARYDKYGPGLTPDGTTIDLPVLNFDPNVFYAVVFNSQLVEPYIGDLMIASFTDDIMHIAYRPQTPTPDEMYKILFTSSDTDNYKAQKRQVDIALFLRTQVDPYVKGQVSADEFRAQCRTEARKIADGSYYGYQFLQIIGTSLKLESQQFIGLRQLYSIPGIVTAGISSGGKTFHRAKRLWTAIQKAFAVIRVLVGAYEESTKLNGGDGTRSNIDNQALMEEQIHKLLPEIMDMAWAYNSHDISATLNGACNKLFIDAGANSKYKRMERAEAIKILGDEFIIEAKKKFATKFEQQQQKQNGQRVNDNDLMARLEVAFRISSMKANGQDTPRDPELMIKQQQRRQKNGKQTSRVWS